MVGVRQLPVVPLILLRLVELPARVLLVLWWLLLILLRLVELPAMVLLILWRPGLLQVRAPGAV